jgi:hypothetical protein
MCLCSEDVHAIAVTVLEIQNKTAANITVLEPPPSIT